jgi:cysteinyl-tRNA synthetase
MPDLHLRLYDTLTAQLVPLVPRHAGDHCTAGVYTCGPTTYDVAHIGHARAALAPDVLVRYLRGQGIQVTYVRNITDVEDKILKRAQAEGTTPLELSSRMAKLYQEDVHALGCAAPDVEPKVSDHIPEIVALIERLVALGAAYEVAMPSGARDVYYSVRAFPGYGKLSKRNVDDMRVGARVEASEDKRDPLDFALWKGCPPHDGGDPQTPGPAGHDAAAWGWDSPWGKGRPGWHIECSAMSARYLGHGFDVHCGGMDLIFPHHENEIAQSEAAHPGEGNFVTIWIHNGFVNVDREKMSKSLGNFVTIRDVLGRNDPEALRYFLLGVHYRGPINFDVEVRCLPCGARRQVPDPQEGAEEHVRVLKSDEPCPGCGQPGEGRVVFPGVLEAERRVDYIYQAMARLGAIELPGEETRPTKIPKDLTPFAKMAADSGAKVNAALDDDLNTPVALAVVGELAKAANEVADLVQRKKKDADLQRAIPFVAAQVQVALHCALAPLGLLQTPPPVYRERTQAQRLAILGLTPAQIDARLAERTAARKDKDFARGDALRRELDVLGIEIADSPEGTTWRVAPGGRRHDGGP